MTSTRILANPALPSVSRAQTAQRRARGFAPLLIALLWLVWPSTASAQLQLLQMEGTLPRPVSPAATIHFGIVPLTGYFDISFRIQNTGTKLAAVELMKIEPNNTGFSFQGEPTLPMHLDGGKMVAFRIRFRPSRSGPVKATFRLKDTSNEITYALSAEGAPTATLYQLRDGVATPLEPGPSNPVSFGMVKRGDAASRQFRIANDTQGEIEVKKIEVTGRFRVVAAGVTTPFRLAPGASVDFSIQFDSLTIGPAQGTLEIDGLFYTLDAYSLAPPTPQPRLVLEPERPVNGQQAKVRVFFDQPSPLTYSGELSLGFTPMLPGEGTPVADPSIVFVANSGKTVTFTIREGESEALFQGQQLAVLQTGTTAGTLTLTAKVQTQQAALDVPLMAAPVVIATTAIKRVANAIELVIKGFDNTRTASSMAFRFSGTTGQSLHTEPIQKDVGASFRDYFKNAPLGGMFSLRAVFMVSGDTEQVAGLQFEMTNAAGSVSSAKLTF
jgi:hypothetical protein